MLPGYNPMTEYRVKLIEVSYRKGMSYDTEREIADILVSYPENEREKIAKQIYEIVLNCDTEEQILQEIRQSDL